MTAFEICIRGTVRGAPSSIKHLSLVLCFTNHLICAHKDRCWYLNCCEPNHQIYLKVIRFSEDGLGTAEYPQ